MTRDEAKDILHRKNLKDRISQIITKVVLSVDYSKTNQYKIGYHKKNEKTGILQYVFEEWIWGWHNSINTNYSCLQIIINCINQNNEKQITYGDFIKNPNETLLYFEDRLFSLSQYLFAPGSVEFSDMYFATQFSWALGKISEISTVYTLSKNETSPIKYTIFFDRGLKEDMYNSIDFYMTSTGQTFGTQGKKVTDSEYINSNGFYVWNCFIDKDRMKAECITIDNGNYVYLYKYNSDRCYMYDGKLLIHKSLFKKKMENQGKEFSKILTKIVQHCNTKRIPFHYVIDVENATHNSIEMVMDNDEEVVKVCLHDIHDTNLVNMVTEFYQKLISTP